MVLSLLSSLLVQGGEDKGSARAADLENNLEGRRKRGKRQHASTSSLALSTTTTTTTTTKTKAKGGKSKGNTPPGVEWLDQSKIRLRQALGRLARHRSRQGRSKVEPNVYVTSTLPVQGQTVAVFVSVSRPRTPVGWLKHHLRTFAHDDLVQVSFGGKSVPSYPLRESRTRSLAAPMYRALIPTTPLDKPGERDLEIKVLDDRYKSVTIPCNVQKQAFETQHIWLKGKKSGLLSKKKSRRESTRVSAWQNLETAEQLWDGPFIAPSDGVITTQYGQQRYYNGKFAKNYYHRGIDYGADKGAPVSSPASGRVVLVGFEDKGFDLLGNCVGLDHGQGVASMFMHLDEVKVKVGSKVKKGQTLGSVGDTGIATGPHLHWGLFVHGQCVDPYMWMNYKKTHRLIF